MNSPEAGIPTVKLEEDSNVIRLILQYMHLVPQPDITKLKFPLLEALSQAVEKYLIFSAMMVCKLCMKDNVARYPMSVLRYAVTYQYKDLANVAAGYAAKRSILESRQFFGPHSRVFQAWSAYKDQWMAALPTIYTEHIPVGGLHKGGIPECDLWAPFVDGIRKDVKCSVAGVMEFGDLIEKRIDAHLESCERCTVRARRWSGSVTSIVGEALQFSDFMWGS
ncbi:hypothetical protein H0H93_004884 [Arthromyces matolae]|nr:hypothetical protein H0H93_004884 [Arthromyces matolae]